MKQKLTFVLLAAVLFLTQCNSKDADKLTGIWRLEYIEVNGTKLSSESLGKPMWEFNNKGGYLINIAGEKEKGEYKIKDGNITFSSITYKEKAPQTFLITTLDSNILKFESNTENNKVAIEFEKLNGELQAEND
jgi:hypothetical protein